MTSVPPDHRGSSPAARVGRQPIAFVAAALVVAFGAIGSVAVWQIASGAAPVQERITPTRLMQSRVMQASEQFVEKTKDLELSQQQSIDELQAVHGQLQAIRQLLAAQQSETKRLSDQVGEVTTSLDNLRQSFASSRPTETAMSAPVDAKYAVKRPRPKTGKARAVRNRARAAD